MYIYNKQKSSVKLGILKKTPENEICLYFFIKANDKNFLFLQCNYFYFDKT